MASDPDYDLSSVVGEQVQGLRFIRLFLLALGCVFLGPWAVFVLPLFFESPHPISTCFRVCTAYPTSLYWVMASLQTGVYLFLGLFTIFGALYLRRAAPTRLAVTTRGLCLTLANGRTAEVRWPSRWSYYPLTDYREAPQSVRNANPPGLLQVGGRSIRLTSQAVDGILAMAKAVGCRVGSFRGDATRTSSDPGFVVSYRIWGPPRGRAQPASPAHASRLS